MFCSRGCSYRSWQLILATNAINIKLHFHHWNYVVLSWQWRCKIIPTVCTLRSTKSFNPFRTIRQFWLQAGSLPLCIFRHYGVGYHKSIKRTRGVVTIRQIKLIKLSKFIPKIRAEDAFKNCWNAKCCLDRCLCHKSVTSILSQSLLWRTFIMWTTTAVFGNWVQAKLNKPGQNIDFSEETDFKTNKKVI